MIKMHNLKSVSLLLMLAVFTVPALAQPGPGGPGRGPQMTEDDVKERIANLADTLGLTAEQEKQLLDYELGSFKKMQEERENFDFETGDREAFRERMRSLREERDAKYAEVLTEEQYKKYQQMMEERRQQMRDRRPGERPPDREGQRGRGRG